MTTELTAGTGELRQATARDGIMLPYEVLGAGEPVVFLHGGLAGRDSFARQKPLATSFRLILRDLRGHNGVAAGDLNGYSFETAEVDDLLAVMDAECIERADLVGHSSGGAIAFAFARRRPERVRRLVLLEPSLCSFMPAEVRAEVVAGIAEDREIAERDGARAAHDHRLRLLSGPDWETRLPPAAVAQMRGAIAIRPAHGEALLALDVSAGDLHQLASPTLLFYAGRSFPWERAISERFAELRPDLRQILIEDAGHNMHIQRTERVNAAIRAFLTHEVL